MKVGRLNRKHSKSKPKDGCSQQKLKFVIFQQVNVISLLLQILAAIENCHFSRMRTLNFTFEPHFLNTMELLNSCKHFVR